LARRRARQLRISASTGAIHGRSSLTLIGPPMNTRPEKRRGSFGTASPASSAIASQGTALRSRKVAK
jgi:hypothetical protein